MCFCIHKHTHTHTKCTHLWEVLGWGGELVNSKVHRSHNIYPPPPSPLMRRRPAAAWSYLEKYLIFISICCMIWSPGAISWHRHLNAANSWIERGRDGLQRATIVMIRSRVNPFCTGGWEDIYFFPPSCCLLEHAGKRGRRDEGGDLTHAFCHASSLGLSGYQCREKTVTGGEEIERDKLCVGCFFSQSIGWIYQFRRRRTRLTDNIVLVAFVAWLLYCSYVFLPKKISKIKIKTKN